MTARLLDAFCGAGGATRGYQLAGFHVTGIDIADQPNYCGDAFVQGNALSFIADHGHEFDAIHASPPCQGYTALTTGTNAGRTAQPRMVAATRALLDLTGRPYQIENVVGSDVRPDLTLCGEVFGLGVIRHRLFELGGWTMRQPEHIKHRGRVRGWRHGTLYDGVYLAVYGAGGRKGTVAEWQEAMGIFWTDDRKEIAEALPPAFTEFVGYGLLEHLTEQAAA